VRRGNDGAADGQPVQAVGQIHGVGRADQHEDDKNKKWQKREEAQMRDVVGHCQSRSAASFWMNGTVSCVENILNCDRTANATATAAPAMPCQRSLARAVSPRLRRWTTLM